MLFALLSESCKRRMEQKFNHISMSNLRLIQSKREALLGQNNILVMLSSSVLFMKGMCEPLKKGLRMINYSNSLKFCSH